ncbi:MAG: hypothetical protein CM15mP22_5180 [Gammaproteobacteria bacterium]|nr:MAG: hypothetical protein CM15mP22_5180 [Gammaproteobacteria bacterium]
MVVYLFASMMLISLLRSLFLLYYRAKNIIDAKVLNYPTQVIQHAVGTVKGELVANGAFNSLTGSRTGRSPADRFFCEGRKYQIK